MIHINIILISGKAGCGKDTAGQVLSKKLIGKSVFISFADELKRQCRTIYGIPNECLWGKSEARNELVRTRPSVALEAYKQNLGLFIKEYDVAPTSFNFDTLIRHFSYVNDRIFSVPRDGAPPTWAYPTVRKILQLYGTEYGRAIQLHLWSKIVERTIAKLARGGFGYEKEYGLIYAAGSHFTNFIITDHRFDNEGWLCPESTEYETVDQQYSKILTPTITTIRIKGRDTTLTADTVNHVSECLPNAITHHIVNDGSISDLDEKLTDIAQLLNYSTTSSLQARF